MRGISWGVGVGIGVDVDVGVDVEEVTMKVIVEVTKNAAGKDYLKRRRWRLSNAAYEAYKKHQLKQEDFPLIQFSSKEPLFDN